jgi:hypothetical protein
MDDGLPDIATLLKRIPNAPTTAGSSRLTVPAPPPALAPTRPRTARARNTAPPPLWNRTDPSAAEVDALVKSVSPAVVMGEPEDEPESESEPESASEDEEENVSEDEEENVSEDEEGENVPARPARKKRAPANSIDFGVPAAFRTHPPDLRTWTRLGLSGATIHSVPHVTFSTSTETIQQPRDLAEAADHRARVWANADDLIVVSMDPAIKHFAIRVERRSRDGTQARLLYFDVLDLDPTSAERKTDESVPKTKRRKTGKSLASGELRTYGLLTALFHSYPLKGYLSGAHIILVEHQHDWKNPLASRISGHALGVCSGLLATQPHFTAPLLVEMHSKAKDDAILVSPKTARRFLPALPLTWSESIRASSIKKLSRACRKTASIETALLLTFEWDDQQSHAVLNKRGETKRDDLADCVCHIEAFRRWIGWGPVRALADAP